MFDIGMGEFLVIGVVAVLILGPDRLPRAISEVVKWARVLREQALNARREIVSAANLDPGMTDQIRRSVSDLADLHPRRLASTFLSDVATDAPAKPPGPSGAATPVTPATPATPVTPPTAGPVFDPDAT